MITASAPADPALQVSGARRRLANRAVLADVSLTVPRGAIVAVAGPNGAGKSSLLRAVGGRLALDQGEVRIAGLDAATARRRGCLGVVPQDVALNDCLSVRENLRLWGALAGTPREVLSARIDDGLAWIGLADRGAWRVNRLSGGMRRRVNLLAGLLHRPSLLLLDEPTAGVDRDARRLVYALLDDLRRDGVGMLLVTHDLDEAAPSCDAVVVLDHGAVVAAGAVATVLHGDGAPSGEVVVVVQGDSERMLTAEGFAPAEDGTWVRAADGATDLATLERRLTVSGVVVVELRLRRPTLSGAVARAIARHRSATT